MPDSMPSRARSAGSIQRRSSSSGMCSATVSAIFARVVASSSVSERARPARGPSRPGPRTRSRRRTRGSGRRATRPSRAGRRCTSGTPRRAGSCRCPPGPTTDTRRARRSRAVAWNRSLSRRSSSSRPTNGASSVSLGSARRARRRPGRAPGGDGRGLALEDLLAGLLEGDRAAGGRAGSPRRRGPCPGAGDRLEPRRRVDEVARDHALVGGADRDRRLAGQDAGPGLDPGPERGTASTRSRPARTARSASSSWATGAPQTAMTASPMNFSTVPPYRPMTSLARSK